MNMPVKQVVESDYEVKLGVFEGPLDLLLYLVQKNELNPREIPIAVITDQYLKYIDGIEKMNLSNAGEFLVMASRLMRLKARELLPADQKDELEEMEYELDRQALIQQMLEYQKFKEAARVLRNFEGKNFGAFARGREEDPEERKDAELEEEAGIFDLLAAFRSVVMSRTKRIPVHEVEVDDVTIEDRMQEVEIALNESGRLMFEDLFPHDHRTIMKVVTLMSMLELCKLDRVVFRQSHALGPIWVYRKAKANDYELELKGDDGHQEPLPEFKPGLPELIREQAKARTAQTALEAALRELEEELTNPGAAAERAAKAAEAEQEAKRQAEADAEALKAAQHAAAAAGAAEAARADEAHVTQAADAVAEAAEAVAEALVVENLGAEESQAAEPTEPGAEGAGEVAWMDAMPAETPAAATVGAADVDVTVTEEAEEEFPEDAAAPEAAVTAVEVVEADSDEEPEEGAEPAGTPVEVGTYDEERLAAADAVTALEVTDEAPAAEAEPDAPPTPEESAALKDFLERLRDAPEPDLSVPDPDGED